MSKVYICPDTQVVKIQGGMILTASNPTPTVDPDENVDANEIESRRDNFSIWDDEE